ncbi:hypothetical protein [Paractinoplanes deccanensis]|nr:hypothetical protein [Actinoplanes deccanensis]
MAADLGATQPTNSRDAGAWGADARGDSRGVDSRDDRSRDVDVDVDAADWRDATRRAGDSEPAGSPASGERDADYDRASSAINAARSENPGEDAWRRDPAPSGNARADDARVDDAPVGDSAVGGGHVGGGRAGDVRAEDAGADDGEFAEPDVDDPDDEPLPQAVRPADAVRVARLDDEVLVVDGRPRYHLPDCPHLVGRLTEPIPVGEAVELGFSPCGLCRPVDRLIASTARR